MGLPKKQLEALLYARKVGGPEPRLLVDLAHSYAELKNYDGAQTTWEEFIRKDPKNADLGYQELGALADSKGRLDEAERMYRKCVELQPSSENYKIQLARLLLQRRDDRRRLQESVRLLEEAMRLSRDTAQVYYELGLAFAHVGRREEAILALRHAIDLEPGEGKPYFQLSRLLLETGRREEGAWAQAMHERYLAFLQAQEVLSARVRRSPGNADARCRLAAFYEKAQATQNAIDEYEKVLEQQPVNLDVCRHLASLYAAIGRYEDHERTVALLNRLERRGG
jgi:tetratricopeptide (TPR) repeat protein